MGLTNAPTFILNHISLLLRCFPAVLTVSSRIRKDADICWNWPRTVITIRKFEVFFVLNGYSDGVLATVRLRCAWAPNPLLFQSMLASQVPQILAAVFECTLEMINKDMEVSRFGFFWFLAYEGELFLQRRVSGFPGTSHELLPIDSCLNCRMLRSVSCSSTGATQLYHRCGCLGLPALYA